MRRQSGLTLIELMIAVTLSLVIIGALSMTFVTSSRARDEIQRANQQIENGRYAMQVLSDDIRLAGYYGGFDASRVADPVAVPDPCQTTLANLKSSLALHIQGFDNGAGLSATSCDDGGTPGVPPSSSPIDDNKAGSDVVVVRRVATCVRGSTDCAALPAHYYFQASFCSTQLDTAIATGTQDGNAYVLDVTSGTGFNRTQRNCTSIAVQRRLITHIYYIDNANYTNSNGDVVPTLVRAELKGANFNTKTPLAEGIEELEIRYREADGDYIVPTSVDDWRAVMSAEIFLLARAADPSPGHTDAKTYTLGTESFRPADGYKRHVFQTNVHLSNPAGLY